MGVEVELAGTSSYATERGEGGGEGVGCFVLSFFLLPQHTCSRMPSSEDGRWMRQLLCNLMNYR